MGLKKHQYVYMVDYLFIWGFCLQLVRVLYCKLPTNGKQLAAYPLEAMLGTKPRPQRWEARVLLLCHRGPCIYGRVSNLKFTRNRKFATSKILPNSMKEKMMCFVLNLVFFSSKSFTLLDLQQISQFIYLISISPRVPVCSVKWQCATLVLGWVTASVHYSCLWWLCISR